LLGKLIQGKLLPRNTKKKQMRSNRSATDATNTYPVLWCLYVKRVHLHPFVSRLFVAIAAILSTSYVEGFTSLVQRRLFLVSPQQRLQQQPSPPQGRKRLEPLLALSTSDFKNGLAIEFDGTPWRIIDYMHVKPGKGAAFVRTKLRNLLTGNVNDKTWRAGDSTSEADVGSMDLQYTYTEGDTFVFMNMQTFDEERVSASVVGKASQYLKEGTEVKALIWDNRVVGLELPTTLNLRVAQTDPGLKGNSAGSGVTKPATLETGAVVMVPSFIVEGELISVNTEKEEYVSRAQEASSG